MTVATDELPDDVAALKKLVADQQHVIHRIREEAAKQLEAERAGRQAAIDEAVKAAVAALLRLARTPLRDEIAELDMLANRVAQGAGAMTVDDENRLALAA